MSGAQFNFRLASAGGAQAGNACFWFEVRSGGSVIGTHGSYASPPGCSTGTTQTTSRPRSRRSRAPTGLTGSSCASTPGRPATRPRSSTSTSRRSRARPRTTRSPPTRSRRSTTRAAPRRPPPGRRGGRRDDLHGRDQLAVRHARDDEVPQADARPSVPTGSVVTAVSLTNVWHASAAVTNGGTLCYYLETFNGATSLATHGSGASPAACTSSGTVFATDTVSLPEVNDVDQGEQPGDQALLLDLAALRRRRQPDLRQVGHRPRARSRTTYYLD